MSAFNFIAVDFNGKHHRGVREGDNARQVREQLRVEGFVPVNVSIVKETNRRVSLSERFQKRISAMDLSLCTRQMATLLAADIPVDDMLLAVAEHTERPHVKSILLSLRSRVMEGHGLAAAMGCFPKSFPVLYRTTIASGERSGKLAAILESLAEYTEKLHRMKQKIYQALIYPGLMMLVAGSVVTFLLTYVVPKIIDTFTSMHQALPLPTIILLHISSVLSHDGLYLILGLLLVIVGCVRLLRIQSIRYRVDQLLLKSPIFGKAIRKVNTARFSRTLGMLSQAGVPILEALKASSQLVVPLPMRFAIQQSIEQVREGVSLYAALKSAGYFTPMFLHLLASGEHSGELDSMLQKAAVQQEADVDALLQALLTLFEPLLILVMGGIVLFIVLGIMLPIFNMDQMV